MLPRSRAGEKVARATFSRKTPWFQHTFPLSPDSRPGGSQGILGGSRGSLDVSPGLSGGSLRAPPGPFFSDSSRILLRFAPKESFSMIPLPGVLSQASTSRIPPPGFLFQDSFFRIPPQGFLPQDSSSRIPPQGFLLKDSSSRIPPQGFLLKDSSSRFLLKDSSSRIPPLRVLLQQSSLMIPLP